MTTTSADANDRAKRALVLSMLIGPLGWGVFFLVGYLIAEAACQTRILHNSVAGLNLVVVVVLGLALLALLVTGGGAIWNYRRWRERAWNGIRGDRKTEDLATFFALVSMALNVLFALAIVLTALGMLFLEPCQWT